MFSLLSGRASDQLGLSKDSFEPGRGNFSENEGIIASERSVVILYIYFKKSKCSVFQIVIPIADKNHVFEETYYL